MLDIGIIGAKNSGKTNLIEKLIRHFHDRGYRVATIRHSAHDHTFDTPGKDTARHRQAGARMTLGLGDRHLALFGENEPAMVQTIMEIMRSNNDICFVEGDSQSSRPKILLTRGFQRRNDGDEDNIMASFGKAAVPFVATHYLPEDFDKLCALIDEELIGHVRKVSSVKS